MGIGAEAEKNVLSGVPLGGMANCVNVAERVKRADRRGANGDRN
jgi:hypothetical protein